jgi:sugar phosphate isomerase/epimerase
MLGANCLAALFLHRHPATDAHVAALEAIAEAGYAATEISHPGLLLLRSAPPLRSHADRLGLTVSAVHAPPMRRDLTLARQQHAALLAAELGAPLLVVHVSSLRFASAVPTVRAAARDLDLRRLDALVAICQPLRITLGLENGKTPAHADYLLSLLDALDGTENSNPLQATANPGKPVTSSHHHIITSSSPAGLVFDSGHAALRDGDPVDVARRMLPRLLHTHLHDNHGVRDEHRVPGEGIIDWPDLLRCLSEGRYSGARLLELHPQREATAEQWRRDLVRGRKLLSTEGR